VIVSSEFNQVSLDHIGVNSVFRSIVCTWKTSPLRCRTGLYTVYVLSRCVRWC